MPKIECHKLPNGSWWAGVIVKEQMYDFVHKDKKRAISGVRRKLPRTVSGQKARAKRLWKFFRLLPGEHDRIKAFQENHPIFRLLLGQRNSVDHRHDSGQVYGLLEWRANKGLGLIEKFARENTPDVLRALADFYESPPVTTVLGSPRYGIIGLARNKKCKLVYGPPVEKA